METLRLQQASAIVEGALAHGRELKCAPLTVAVLDSGGHLVAFSREDSSGILRPQIAIGKAWGALGMGFGTREIKRRADGNPNFIAAINVASDGRLVPAPGGVLIRPSGDAPPIGAVGISGDTSDRDEACAVHGIEAVGLAADTGA